ncbi:hypothetical protein GCM10008935_28610 [Alkalibacillus silvisoli]|uniref:Uncharacterized protein n=1 Tax=Alkalibacillus silvisoli TaxID=392823 RepID=A0ABN1A9I2_9BACI
MVELFYKRSGGFISARENLSALAEIYQRLGIFTISNFSFVMMLNA